jgi:hypothetical protein
MFMRFRTPATLIVILSFLTLFIARSQTTTPRPAIHVESAQELIARFTPVQKQLFDDAGKAFDAQRYRDALLAYRLLLQNIPRDTVLTKFASEAALNLGDVSFALNTLTPLARVNPDDWQTASLLTRAYAQSGNKVARDTGIAHMLDLHKRGLTPPLMQQYIVERINFDGNSLVIYTSLEPWGHYQVYDYAQFFDANGHLTFRMSIESNESDQPRFVKNDPREASAAERTFSVNGYHDTVTDRSGRHSEAHYIFKFFIGQPTYQNVRDAFINIAAGRMKYISRRDTVLQ